MKTYDGRMPCTPFSRIISVIQLHDCDGHAVWKVELNIPYVPSLLTSNRDYYSESEAIRAAINIESKLNRLVGEWARKRQRRSSKDTKGASA